MSAFSDTVDDAPAPTGFREFMRRRFSELLGTALFVFSLLILLILATYNPADPSLNVATDQAPANIGGPPGAMLADILLQSVGLAAAIIPFVLSIWAVKLLLCQPLRRVPLRLLLLLPAMILAAAGLGIVPSDNWLRLHAGLGGTIGRLLFDPTDANSLISQSGRLFHSQALTQFALVPAATAMAAASLLVFYILGVSPGEWRDVGRSARRMAKASRASTGAIAETVARKSWLADMAARRAAREPAPTPSRGLREISLRARDPGGRETQKDSGAEDAPLAPRRNIASGIVAPKTAAPAPGRRAEQLRQPSLDLDEPRSDYDLPPLTLLAEAPARRETGPSEDALQQNALLLLGVLEDFGVHGEIVKVRPGPVVTLYELEPAPGTKSSRVIGLADDIARSMSAISVRVAVVPGRNVIGIELPNAKSETVYLHELLASDAFERASSRLALVLGKDIGGAPIIADIAKMPHLLIAGTTGSGKSVGINTMILSILYRLPPDQCKFIMIDPKMLELSIYDGIPHLLAPVVTDPKKAIVALKWTVREMENRYRLMSKLGVRNIETYNARLTEAVSRGEKLMRRVQTGFHPETGEPEFEDQPLDTVPLPFIVVVVDEMADLMLVAGKEIEGAIQRLAQMARAAGIHIIMATQRPSVDVITGTIKANFPTRISFQVTSKIDSRTILGESGAEQLLGRGDMLYMMGGGRITRVHGPFVSDEEVEAVVKFLRQQGAPSYVEDITAEPDEEESETGSSGDDPSDDLYDRAVALICRERKASTSFVQRHLQIGYNRAARIMEKMEQEGVVSAANHVGKREVLAPPGR